MSSIRKRGQGLLYDGVAFGIIIIVFIYLGVTAFPVVSDVIDEVRGVPEANLTAHAGESFDVVQQKLPDWLDAAAITIMVFFAIAIFLSGLLVRVHPGFIVLGIVLLIVFGIVGFVLQDVWDELSDDDLYADVGTDFPIVNWILNNFGVLMVVYPFLFILPFFAKNLGVGR